MNNRGIEFKEKDFIKIHALYLGLIISVITFVFFCSEHIEKYNLQIVCIFSLFACLLSILWFRSIQEAILFNKAINRIKYSTPEGKKIVKEYRCITKAAMRKHKWLKGFISYEKTIFFIPFIFMIFFFLISIASLIMFLSLHQTQL